MLPVNVNIMDCIQSRFTHTRVLCNTCRVVRTGRGHEEGNNYIVSNDSSALVVKRKDDCHLLSVKRVWFKAEILHLHPIHPVHRHPSHASYRRVLNLEQKVISKATRVSTLQSTHNEWIRNHRHGHHLQATASHSGYSFAWVANDGLGYHPWVQLC